jgi:hypothetical protein
MWIADGPEPRVAHRVFTQRLDVRRGNAERILDTVEVG